MATTHKTPGVYIEEIPKFPPSIAAVETAIPAFIGYTEKAERNGVALPVTSVIIGTENVSVSEPVRISSLLEYVNYFGTSLKDNLRINIQDYYDKSWTGVTATTTPQPIFLRRVITANGPTHFIHTMYYHMQMYFANGGGPCYIVSVGQTSSSTISKDNFLAGLEVIKKFDEPTLLVFPQGNNLNATDLYDVYDSALIQAAELKDRFVVMDCHGDDYTTLRSSNGIGMNNLKYGASYHPYLKTSLNYLYDENLQSVVHDKLPINSGGTRVPGDLDAKKISEIPSGLKEEVEDAISNQTIVVLPPCSSIVGVYALIDSTRGVWKAPANTSLNFVNAPTIIISDTEQETLKIDVVGGKSVNAIRAFTGKGVLVWGARTLAGNDNEWRYISVRRFFIMVEESIKKATAQFVFEPNDANTWVKVQAMIENFLITLWRQGALQGVKPEHAFYVAVGLGKTMTALDILEGRMIVEIGMAALRPAEFIILRFSHKMAES